ERSRDGYQESDAEHRHAARTPEQPHTALLHPEGGLRGGSQLLLATPDGHHTRDVVRGPEGWEVGLETRCGGLEDALRLLQVLEPVLTEVVERHLFQSGSDEVAGGRGDEDLAAVRGAGDPRSSAYVQPVVSGLSKPR